MTPPRDRRAARLVYTEALAKYGEGTNEAAAAWQAYMRVVCPDKVEVELTEEAEL